MATFSYKKTTNTALKVSGVLYSDDLTITCEEKDGDVIVRSIPSLLSEFNDQDITLSITLKTEENLKEPDESNKFDETDEADE